MTCLPEINRRYETRHEAWEYLASRGFSCDMEGWRNGRWLAQVEHDDRSFNVKVWLPSQAHG